MMSKKEFNLAAAKFLYKDALGYNQHDTGCVEIIGSDNIGKQVIDVISQDGLSDKQLNDLVEKIGMDVYFYDEPRRWRADIELTKIQHDDESRNKAMLMCAAEYLEVDYESL